MRYHTRVDTLLSVLIGVGLAAACGFRVFVPLLVMSLASRAEVGHLSLGPGFAWIGSTPALVAFSVATLLEIAGYYIPWVDNLLDTVATPTAIVAGILVTASAVTDMSPFLRWSLMRPRRHPAAKVLRAAAGLGVFIGLGVLGALIGCTTGRPGDRSDIERTLRSRGLDPATVVIPYAIDETMRAWVHRQVPDEIPLDQRLDRLLAGLVSGEHALQYEGRHTATAREAFATGRANCLAFTSVFVGLAREIGVGVVYLDVDDIEKFEKEGDLVVVSGHVSAGFNAGTSLRILDFSAAPTAHYRKVHPVSDLTAIALYHSNRGAELLRAGQSAEAMVWLKKAVAIDPDLGRAWVNYGVALRRGGDSKGAEAAYRKALEVDPLGSSAYQNLASLLRARGESKEADELLAVSQRLDGRNPYVYLALGDVSFAHGRFEEARRLYRKAMRLYGKNAEPYAALGLVALATGDAGDAARWLKKAVSIDQENDRVKQLAGRLGRSGGRG